MHHSAAMPQPAAPNISLNISAYLLTHSDGSKSMQLLKKSTPKTYEYFRSLTINGEPLLGGSHAEEVKNY